MTAPWSGFASRLVASRLAATQRTMEAYAPLFDLADLGVCALYFFLAIGRAYGARGFARFGQAVALTVAFAAIALGYRFAIFVFTLYTT